jgi:glutaredoxin
MTFTTRNLSKYLALDNSRIVLQKGLIFVFYLLLTAISPSVAEADGSSRASNPESNANFPQPVDIEVFVRTGCPHCANAKKYLAYLKEQNPKLNIVFHDLAIEPAQLERLQQFAEQQGEKSLRVPAFRIGNELIIGYSDAASTGQLIRNALTNQQLSHLQFESKSCGVDLKVTCKTGTAHSSDEHQAFQLSMMGYTIALDRVGLPLFTLAMGLLDGFNPCSLWVLVLMISLLAPMQDRLRMFVIAGTFILVEGIAYFIFMTAWLNLFLLVGLSRFSVIIIAGFALLAGAVNLKDFWFFGRGFSLSIPGSAKSGIYARMRHVLSAQNLTGAIAGVIMLAVLVQLVELMCTSGFPALYTRILTLNNLDSISYYSYLLLYNIAYMFDDLVILTIGIITLSQKRLQENEGKWLKLISGLVMVGLGFYLLVVPA